jgi:hypothetical protein
LFLPARIRLIARLTEWPVVLTRLQGAAMPAWLAERARRRRSRRLAPWTLLAPRARIDPMLAPEAIGRLMHLLGAGQRGEREQRSSKIQERSDGHRHVGATPPKHLARMYLLR